MLSVLLVSVVFGQMAPNSLEAEAAHDAPMAFANEAEAFEEGDIDAMPAQDTFSAPFHLTTELLPTYTSGYFSSGTTGTIAAGTNGMGFHVSLDETTIDVAILQLEPDEVKLLKDAINTIDFMAKLHSTAPYAPPTLEFAISFGGQEPESGTTVSKQVCFKDTIDKVEMLVGAMMAGGPPGGPPPMGPGSGSGAGEMPPMTTMPPGSGSGSGSARSLQTYEPPMGSGSGSGSGSMPPMTPAMPTAMPPAMPPMAPPAGCVDDPIWTDSYGDSCAWYQEHDPGCLYYTQPDGDYGQFANCKATCNTCAGVQACPPHPIIHNDGYTEEAHFCVPAQEQFEICDLEADGVTVKQHVVTAADFSFTKYDETSMDLTFSLTGAYSPDFELKGTFGLSGIIAPDPGALGSIPEPTYCTQWLNVEMLAGAAAGPVASAEAGRFCDFTSPEEEPCCAETSYEAQDACLEAAATGGHLCDNTDPNIEPCCLQASHEDQDACLEAKGIPTTAPERRLGDGVDEVTKKIALQTLKKLHAAKGTAKTLFKDYKDEKARLVRKTIVEYSVAALVALLFAGGAVRYCRVRKSYVAASTDEEMLMEADVTSVTE
jgi:hypothetical protein